MFMRRRRSKDERGASAVEFAMVVLPLALLCFGIINFGIVFAQDLALGNGARQAARFAAVEGRDCAAVRTEAKDNSVSIAMPPGAITDADIDIAGDGFTPGCPGEPCDGSNLGNSVHVTITHESDFLIPMPIPGFPTGLTLTGEGEFRCEFS
jgi:hypothetical protein